MCYICANQEDRLPKEPLGQKRPTDAFGNAVHIAKIASGEIEETTLIQIAKRKSGLAGSKARVKNTTKAEREAIARLAARVR
jgi:hypothetical protein